MMNNYEFLRKQHKSHHGIRWAWLGTWAAGCWEWLLCLAIGAILGWFIGGAW